MTTRPRHNRPNSAVYLGTDPIHLGSTPPTVPDLPEPPSPVSSTGSGLPSPPGTNSTSSGSTGDPASIAIRGTAKATASMLNDSKLKAFHAAFANDRPDDEDDYNDHDDHGDENDHTARLNENTLAIQRAMSLKERTKMTIDKLSSYSRNSPLPSSSHYRSNDQYQSGSETEREPAESSSRPSTPKFHRTRLISAPASPGKALLGIKQSSSSSSFTNSPKSRKRASMATSDIAELAGGRVIRSPDVYEGSQTSRRFPDVAQAALAAVASSRGRVSPTTSSRKRQPLPREFFDASASSSASGSGSTASVSRRGSITSARDEYNEQHLLTTPMFRPSSTTRHLQLSPRQQKNLNNTLTHSSAKYPLTDPHPNAERASTLRKHQSGGRWVSEDMSHRAGDDEELPNPRGRKQTFRNGGSADSALTVGAGRSLVGEGLKAAGLKGGGTLGRRVDIFDENTPLREKVARDKERAQRLERIERSISRTGSRSYSRIDWEDDEDDEDDRFSNARSRTNGSDVRTRAGTVVGPRASTSMAIMDREREGVGGEPEPRTAPPHLRSHKSSYDLPLSQEVMSRKEIDLDREDRSILSISRHTTDSNPFSSRRFLSTGDTSYLPDRSDHTRLLQDSLHMFEAHVSRVPSTSSATTSDLLRNAQSIAGAAEKLNVMTRAAMSRALEAQINAEVDGRTGDLAADIWRNVGAEYRDQMRVSDELVRSVTDFLLGVGRAVKDMTGGGDGHGRSVSLDELGGRLTRSSLGSDGGSNGSGRRSVESRKSWGDDVKRLSTGVKRSESVLSGRPSSVLNLRDQATPPTLLRTRQANGSLDQSGRLGTLDSQETILASVFEPSPTPAPRGQSNANQDRSSATLDRSRTLPPLSIPKPLGQLPSESLARRNTQTHASTVSRRRPTVSGSNTARTPFPLTSPNVPTTALTVSNADRQDFPGLRSDSSSKSSAVTPRSTVTFSRSSTVSALTGLQQQQQLAEQQRERKRTQSNSSTNGSKAAEQAIRITRAASGSENEQILKRTVGRLGERPRMSLDGSGALNGNVHPADRSAATSILTSTSKTQERRKAVVDVWPRG